jgi:hypothetical protein
MDFSNQFSFVMGKIQEVKVTGKRHAGWVMVRGKG